MTPSALRGAHRQARYINTPPNVPAEHASSIDEIADMRRCNHAPILFVNGFFIFFSRLIF